MCKTSQKAGVRSQKGNKPSLRGAIATKQSKEQVKEIAALAMTDMVDETSQKGKFTEKPSFPRKRESKGAYMAKSGVWLLRSGERDS